MKRLTVKIILIAAIGLVSFKVMAQKSKNNVPQVVLTNFSANYPQVKLEHWKINKDTCIASFNWTHRKYQVFYSKAGGWLRSERIIRHKTSLPTEAQLFIKTGKYASWYIDELKSVKTPSESLFLVSIDNNNGNAVSYDDNGSVENKVLYFDASGKLVNVIEL